MATSMASLARQEAEIDEGLALTESSSAAHDAAATNNEHTTAPSSSRIGPAFLAAMATLAAALVTFLIKYHSTTTDGALLRDRGREHEIMSGVVEGGGGGPNIADDPAPSGGSNSSSASIDPFKIDYRQVECLPCAIDADNATLVDPLAPMAIIGGTMKGGTRALLTYLSQHPMVYTTQGSEIHLFDERHYPDVFPKDADGLRYGNVVDRCKVLRTYGEIFEEKRLEQQHGEEGKAFFDKTPSYMEYSHIIPQRILCVLPNVKVIMVLRNPVDRAYSHYQHCRHKYEKKHRDESATGCKGLSFEEAVQQDLDALGRAGVLDAALGGDDAYDVEPMEEYGAWVRYHNFHGADKGNLMIAKSLYAIQLRQWIAVLRDRFGGMKDNGHGHGTYGDDNDDDDDNFLNHLLVMESEWMHLNKQAAYDRALDFVGLPRHLLDEDEDYHVGKYEPMRNDTRARLENFFRPFNGRLHELLSPFRIEFSWARPEESR